MQAPTELAYGTAYDPITDCYCSIAYIQHQYGLRTGFDVDTHWVSKLKEMLNISKDGMFTCLVRMNDAEPTNEGRLRVFRTWCKTNKVELT